MNETLTHWIEAGQFLSTPGNIQNASFLATIVLISNGLTALAFYSVCIGVIRFRGKHSMIQAPRATAIFFILAFAAGTAHLLAIWIPSSPVHRIDAIMKIVIALVSVAAAIAFWRLGLKPSLAVRNDTRELRDVILQLEHEVGERKGAQQALQKSQELLHQLAAYQERVKEDERKRIAREIHDELGQNLMALRIDVSVLQARIAEMNPTLNEKFRIALGHIDTSIKSVRSIINNLRPSVLDLGLHAAIEWQVNEFERRSGIACTLTMDDEKSGSDLDDDRATALFRILQESLTNVARHARASKVQIDLRRQDDLFSMRIADNGVGLYPGCRRKPNSFGLLGISERVSTLGGEFSVESDAGQGTVLTVKIPVEAPVAVDE